LLQTGKHFSEPGDFIVSKASLWKYFASTAGDIPLAVIFSFIIYALIILGDLWS